MWKEESYCNKMVVLFYPSMDREEYPGDSLLTAKEKIRSWPRSVTG